LEADKIVKAGLTGGQVSPKQAEALKTTLLLFCARAYARLGWVMQIHYNCLRNPNSAMFAMLGPDSGFDCAGRSGRLYCRADFVQAFLLCPHYAFADASPGSVAGRAGAPNL
jgi:glucuronate isomerase